MGDIKTRGRLEELAVSKLQAHGWTLTGGERRGVDLDLFVQFEGIRGKVCFRNAFEPPQEAAESVDSAPYSVWIELGEPAADPTVEPSRWSLWDRYTFSNDSRHPKFIATIIHEAIGTSWTKVAGGHVASRHSEHAVGETLDTLISRAECLSPSRDEADRRREIGKTQRHNFGAQEKELNVVLVVVLFSMSLVTFVAYNLSEWLKKGHVMVGLAASSVIWMLVPLLFVLIKLKRRFRRRGAPLTGMDAVVNVLRLSGAFDAFDVTEAKIRHGLPVVVRSQNGYLDQANAPLAVSRVKASSSQHGVTLEADLCEIRWPEGLVPEIRFLPQRWLLVDLIGSTEQLDQLPSHHRADRLEDRLRWLITGEELDGSFENLLRAASASLAGTAAPYR